MPDSNRTISGQYIGGVWVSYKKEEPKPSEPIELTETQKQSILYTPTTSTPQQRAEAAATTTQIKAVLPSSTATIPKEQNIELKEQPKPQPVKSLRPESPFVERLKTQQERERDIQESYQATPFGKASKFLEPSPLENLNAPTVMFNPMSPYFIGGVAKAGAKFALDMPVSTYILGGRVAMFVDAAKEAAFNKQYERETFRPAGREAIGKVPGVLAQQFNPLTPTGLVNIGLTAVAVKSQASAFRASAAKTDINLAEFGTKRIATEGLTTEDISFRVKAYQGKEPIDVSGSLKGTYKATPVEDYLFQGKGEMVARGKTTTLNVRGLAKEGTAGQWDTTTLIKTSTDGKEIIYPKIKIGLEKEPNIVQKYWVKPNEEAIQMWEKGKIGDFKLEKSKSFNEKYWGETTYSDYFRKGSAELIKVAEKAPESRFARNFEILKRTPEGITSFIKTTKRFPTIKELKMGWKQAKISYPTREQVMGHELLHTKYPGLTEKQVLGKELSVYEKGFPHQRTIKGEEVLTATISTRKTIIGQKQNIFIDITKSQPIIEEPFFSAKTVSSTFKIGRRVPITESKPVSLSAGSYGDIYVENILTGKNIFKKEILTESGQPVATEQFMGGSSIEVGAKYFKAEKPSFTRIKEIFEKPKEAEITSSGSILKQKLEPPKTTTGQAVLNVAKQKALEVGKAIKTGQVLRAATKEASAISVLNLRTSQKPAFKPMATNIFRTQKPVFDYKPIMGRQTITQTKPAFDFKPITTPITQPIIGTRISTKPITKPITRPILKPTFSPVPTTIKTPVPPPPPPPPIFFPIASIAFGRTRGGFGKGTKGSLKYRPSLKGLYLKLKTPKLSTRQLTGFEVRGT